MVTSRRRRAGRIVRLPGRRVVEEVDTPPLWPPPTRTGTTSSPRSESAPEPNARFRSLDWDWREPVGTAGAKMASTSSTRAAGSTWTATRTGSLRRPHTLNGGLRTNLVKQTNRRQLCCEANARLPNQSRSSFLEWSLGPKSSSGEGVGRLTAGPWHAVALHERP